MTVVPFYIPLMLLLDKWLEDMDFDTASDIIGGISILSIFLAGILYIVA